MLTALLFLLALPSGDGPALEGALSTVDAQDICADVRFIASDELEGRDTPSQGLRLAARYIRSRLERLGFQPGGDDGFFDRYQLERSGIDTGNSRAWIRRGSEQTELHFGQDYVFRSGGAGHELEGAVVYVGAGSAEELQGIELAGRWALVLEGETESSRRPGRSGWSERSDRVRERGALGLLVAPDPRVANAAERDERIARMASYSGQPSLRVPAPASEAPPFPSLSLTSKTALALLGGIEPPPVGRELAVRLKEKRVALPREVVELENVAGLWPGKDPELAREVIVLSAHYDHVGVHDGQIYNGADDNGSGTCGLLAVAEALARYGPMRRSVLCLWVSGEEKGLLGSQAWAGAPTLSGGMRAICNLNVDMIGRNAPDSLLITPTAKHPAYNGLTRLAESLAPLEGFPELGGCDDYWNRSDQASFSEQLKIPVAFLFADVHDDYHQPTDDAEKIDCDKIRRVVRLLVRMLDALQADQLAL